jgi:chlorobactene glucosyltransferase
MDPSSPSTLAQIAHWGSLGGLALLNLAWGANLLKMLRGAPQPPEVTLGDDPPTDPLPDPPPSLSVLIPARNEAQNIEACVRSVLASGWPGALEIICIDDRSTDDTGPILARLSAEDARVRVVAGRDPPAGWLGKPHALHLGQAAATGTWLLFLDADVRVAPDGLRRLLGRVLAQEAEMASALGRLTVDSFWERVVQTRMGAVIAGGNPLPEVNDPEHERALANGQCLLFSRAAYDRLGGHEAIRGSVLDDVDFAKRAKAEKVRYRLYYGPGVFSCRMYTGLREIWHGWTKNLFPALSYSLIATAVVTLLLFVTTLLPFVLLAKNLALLALGLPYEPALLALEVAACGLILATDAVGHAQHGYRWGLFFTFPLGMAIVIAVFWNSAWRIKSGRGAIWKGRIVEAGPRRG